MELEPVSLLTLNRTLSGHIGTKVTQTEQTILGLAVTHCPVFFIQAYVY